MIRVHVIIVSAGAALALSGVARAQEAAVTEVISDDSFDASALSSHEGNGYTVSRGLQLHSSIELAGGATDNVFHQSALAAPIGSGVMRLTGTLDLATDRVKPEDLGDSESDFAQEVSSQTYTFRGGLGAAYEEYLSGKSTVRAQRNLTLHANVDLAVSPSGPFSVMVRDRFVRDVRSPNFEDSLTLDRDDNRAYIGVRATTGAASATLHFENWLSVFENGQASQFANRVNDIVGLLGELQVLPLTKISADLSYGFYGPLGTSTLLGMPIKTSSQPLRAVAGLSTLFTSQTSLKVHAGYAHSSYDVGEGYSAPVVGAEFGLRWSPTGRIVALYDYDHFDSFNANFYSDHLFAARAIQQIGPLVFDGGPELRLRHFGGIPALFGPPDRDDRIVSGSARAQLLVAEKYSLSAEYRLAIVHTGYRASTLDSMGNAAGTYDPGFVRNEFWLGFRAAY